MQVLDESFGLYLWPAATLLARYVWANRDAFKGRCVVELGAGVGLPGLVAAAVGGDVTLTDRAAHGHVLENCRAACQHNKVQAKVVRHTPTHMHTLAYMHTCTSPHGAGGIPSPPPTCAELLH